VLRLLLVHLFLLLPMGALALPELPSNALPDAVPPLNGVPPLISVPPAPGSPPEVTPPSTPVGPPISLIPETPVGPPAIAGLGEDLGVLFEHPLGGPPAGLPDGVPPDPNTPAGQGLHPLGDMVPPVFLGSLPARPTPVPEPTTALLLGMGLLAIAGRPRRT
jgi:hypothetical protein